MPWLTGRGAVDGAGIGGDADGSGGTDAESDDAGGSAETAGTGSDEGNVAGLWCSPRKLTPITPSDTAANAEMPAMRRRRGARSAGAGSSRMSTSTSIGGAGVTGGGRVGWLNAA